MPHAWIVIPAGAWCLHCGCLWARDVDGERYWRPGDGEAVERGAVGFREAAQNAPPECAPRAP